MFLLTSHLQFNTWAKRNAFRVFLLSVCSLENHRLTQISSWWRIPRGPNLGWQLISKDAVLTFSFSLNCMVSILTRREGGLVVGNGEREVSDASSSLPHPGNTKLAQNWCCCFVPVFEVFLIQVSRSHWQLHDNMFSPCCFQIENKMRFPLLCPVSLFFSISKSKLDAIIIPLKSKFIVPLPAVQLKCYLNLFSW